MTAIGCGFFQSPQDQQPTGGTLKAHPCLLVFNLHPCGKHWLPPPLVVYWHVYAAKPSQNTKKSSERRVLPSSCLRLIQVLLYFQSQELFLSRWLSFQHDKFPLASWKSPPQTTKVWSYSENLKDNHFNTLPKAWVIPFPNNTRAQA